MTNFQLVIVRLAWTKLENYLVYMLSVIQITYAPSPECWSWLCFSLFQSSTQMPFSFPSSVLSINFTMSRYCISHAWGALKVYANASSENTLTFRLTYIPRFNCTSLNVHCANIAFIVILLATCTIESKLICNFIQVITYRWHVNRKLIKASMYTLTLIYTNTCFSFLWVQE